jgi:hypothetical protein
VKPVISRQCRILADEIQKIFSDGIALDERLFRFLSSRGDATTPASITSLLANDGDCEAESLMALIFAPDEAMQKRLEPILDAMPFRTEDEAALTDMLIEKRPDAKLLFPKDTPPVTVSVPEQTIEPLVAKLHISRTLDFRIKEAIDTVSNLTDSVGIKVRLRNAGLPFTESAVAFWQLFFSQMDPTSPDFFSDVDFALSFLGNNQTETDYRSALYEMRRNLDRQIDRGRQFESALRNGNMETMMLQGERPPAIDVMEALRQIEKIDNLLYRLYAS